MQDASGIQFLIQVGASAITGGAAGALISAYIQKRRKMEDDKKNLAGEIISFSENAIAGFMKLNTVMRTNDTRGIINSLADVRIIVGKGHQMEGQLFANFKNRRTLAAFHRTLVRIELTRKKFENIHEPIGDRELEKITEWIEETEVDAYVHAAEDAGIRTDLPSMYVFAGFTKGQREKRLRELSPDPGPAPWEFHVGLSEEDKLDDDVSRVLEQIKTSVGPLLCPTHALPVHITLTRGSGWFFTKGSRGFDFTFEGCCDDFTSTVRRVVQLLGQQTDRAPSDQSKSKI